MKEPKLCTYSFVIRKGEEDVPFESLSEEEQMEFRKKFTNDFADTYMKQKGYKRVSA